MVNNKIHRYFNRPITKDYAICRDMLVLLRKLEIVERAGEYEVSSITGTYVSLYIIPRKHV